MLKTDWKKELNKYSFSEGSKFILQKKKKSEEKNFYVRSLPPEPACSKGGIPYLCKISLQNSLVYTI